MEWEGVRHPFCLDRVWSSRLLWPMYPFYACYEWYVAHVKQKLNHISLFMNVSFSLFKKFRYVLVIKKFEFGLYKQIRSIFVCVKRKWFLERKFKSIFI